MQFYWNRHAVFPEFARYGVDEIPWEFFESNFPEFIQFTLDATANYNAAYDIGGVYYPDDDPNIPVLCTTFSNETMSFEILMECFAYNNMIHSLSWEPASEDIGTIPIVRNPETGLIMLNYSQEQYNGIHQLFVDADSSFDFDFYTPETLEEIEERCNISISELPIINELNYDIEYSNNGQSRTREN